MMSNRLSPKWWLYNHAFSRGLLLPLQDYKIKEVFSTARQGEACLSSQHLGTEERGLWFQSQPRHSESLTWKTGLVLEAAPKIKNSITIESSSYSPECRFKEFGSRDSNRHTPDVIHCGQKAEAAYVSIPGCLDKQMKCLHITEYYWVKGKVFSSYHMDDIEDIVLSELFPAQDR